MILESIIFISLLQIQTNINQYTHQIKSLLIMEYHCNEFNYNIRLTYLSVIFLVCNR
ncbi:hypothetical protein KSS87_012919 [Heliosperma pusillum]|nr:hypothetical protein KSS87_012919 [Heliosperma pusillum]